MHKFQVIVVLILVAFLCALWSPWNNLNFSPAQLFGLAPKQSIGGLEVSSLAGIIEVAIDGESKGTVDVANSPLIIPAITPGDRQIVLTRKSSTDNAYWEFNKLIKFESGVDVIMAYELGPSSDFSEGHVIYATRNVQQTTAAFLNVKTTPDDVKVSIDDKLIGNSPIVDYALSLDQQHTLKISQTGYDEQQFTLLPSSQTDRDKLVGFNVNVDATLFLQPIEVTQ